MCYQPQQSCLYLHPYSFRLQLFLFTVAWHKVVSPLGDRLKALVQKIYSYNTHKYGMGQFLREAYMYTRLKFS